MDGGVAVWEDRGHVACRACRAAAVRGLVRGQGVDAVDHPGDCGHWRPAARHPTAPGERLRIGADWRE
eukprot:1307478-Lingulodinium_polyedra.AAC.1